MTVMKTVSLQILMVRAGQSLCVFRIWSKIDTFSCLISHKKFFCYTFNYKK